MKKKLNINQVERLLDVSFNLDKIFQVIKPEAENVKLTFAEITTAPGAYQWNLPGDDWTPLSKLNGEEREVAEAMLKQRCFQMETPLRQADERIKKQAGKKEVPSLTNALIVPSYDYVFVRKDLYDGWDIAVTAWGFKFPAQPPVRISAPIKDIPNIQEVAVGFDWNGTLIPDFQFVFNHNPKTTGKDGLFKLDRPLIVGKQYPVETADGRQWTLTVEKGKENYIYELTEYVDIDINVTICQRPAQNMECELSFGSLHQTLVTDDNGMASIRLPLLFIPKNDTVRQQPPCTVTCYEETDTQVPENKNGRLQFNINIRRQNVCISFVNEGMRVPNYEFMLDGKQQKTGEDGIYRLEKPQRVGNSHEVENHFHETERFTVEEGREEYSYDITRYFDVVITAMIDGGPAVGCECEVDFAGNNRTVTIDDTGRQMLRFPYAYNKDGEQPECKAVCKANRLPEEVEPKEISLSKQPNMQSQNLSFIFEFKTPPPPPPEPPKEPEYVYVKLLDYGGYPLVDMPVTIRLKKKGDVQLTTDQDGRVLLDKEWLTEKEKFGVNFIVTADYQANHDLHLKKSKKKKKAQSE